MRTPHTQPQPGAASPASPTTRHAAQVLALARKMGVRATHTLPTLLEQRAAQSNTHPDTRRLCLECAHLETQPGRCTNPRRAGLARHGNSAPVGTDWVTLLQHCPGFAPRRH